MNEQNTEKLKEYYKLLLDHQQVFEEAKRQPEPFNIRIGAGPVQRLAEDVQRIEADFPGLLQPFRMDDFHAFRSLKGRAYYESAKIRTYLSDALTGIKTALGASG